jgi:hypothetical protein
MCAWDYVYWLMRPLLGKGWYPCIRASQVEGRYTCRTKSATIRACAFLELDVETKMRRYPEAHCRYRSHRCITFLLCKKWIVQWTYIDFPDAESWKLQRLPWRQWRLCLARVCVTVGTIDWNLNSEIVPHSLLICFICNVFKDAFSVT